MRPPGLSTPVAAERSAAAQPATPHQSARSRRTSTCARRLRAPLGTAALPACGKSVQAVTTPRRIQGLARLQAVHSWDATHPSRPPTRGRRPTRRQHSRLCQSRALGASTLIRSRCRRGAHRVASLRPFPPRPGPTTRHRRASRSWNYGFAHSWALRWLLLQGVTPSHARGPTWMCLPWMCLPTCRGGSDPTNNRAPRHHRVPAAVGHAGAVADHGRHQVVAPMAQQRRGARDSSSTIRPM